MMMRQEADADMMELARLSAERPAEKLAVRFLVEPQENEGKSKLAGRPIFDDVEMVEIRIPGEVDVRRKPVDDATKKRFPAQYLAFATGKSQEAASGTPLAAWALLKRSQVEEARFFGVLTVEQLSEMADGNMARLGPGWIDLRQKARDWLEAAQDGAKLNELRTELEAAKQRIATMEDMLNRQAASLREAGVDPIRAQHSSATPAVDVEALVAKAVGAALARLAPATPAEPAPVPITKRPIGRPRKVR
jgi:hypothetical protein